jgi:malic enzyme
VIVCNRKGALHAGAKHLDAERALLAERTNKRGLRGTPEQVLAGADVLVGVSGPRAVSAAAVRRMAADAIVFAMANPVPEVQPEEVSDRVAIIATGRSDYPNQINNLLAFPGRVQGRARAARTDDQRADEARRRARDRDRDPRQRTASRLDHPQRLQPPGRRIRRPRRRRRRAHERGRAPRQRDPNPRADNPARADPLSTTPTHQYRDRPTPTRSSS